MLIFTLLGIGFIALFLLDNIFRQQAVRKSIEGRIKATEKTLAAEKKLKDQASVQVHTTLWLTFLIIFSGAFLLFYLNSAGPWKTSIKSQLAFTRAVQDRVLKHAGGSTIQFYRDGTVVYTLKLSKDKRSPTSRYALYWSWSTDNRLCLTNRPVRSVYNDSCTGVAIQRRLKTVITFAGFPLDKSQKKWTLVPN